MDNLLEFFARLHPLIVHLPVAILPIAALGTLLQKQGKATLFDSILPTIWIIGAISASFACLSGLLSTQPIGLHKWMSLGITVGAIGYSIFLLKGKRYFRGIKIFAALILVVTLVTTYFGATITYGERFLVKRSSDLDAATEIEASTFGAIDIPADFIEAADPLVLENLRKQGFILLPVGNKSNYLSVNSLNVVGLSDSLCQALSPLKNHIVWLKLGDKPITDATLQLVAQMKNLSRLHLERTNITDLGLQYLQSLSRLYLLNLTGTAVTNNGVAQLASLSQLKQVYLFNTKVTKIDWQVIKNSFPNTLLDTGGYVVPTWMSDTVLLKDPKMLKK
jgi:hypothetical protein